MHVPLLERLTKDGARLIVYDIIFDTPSLDPARDAAFADALQSSGKAILGGGLDIVQPMGGVKQERIIAPLKLFRKAAAGWGTMVFNPVDADYAVRQLFPGTSDIPSGTWKAAEVLGATATQGPREALVQRWINYYGPKNTFSSVNLAQALDPQGVPPGYFKDKIVMVGVRSGCLAESQDEFRNALFAQNSSIHLGAEVHATVLLNLLRGEWLTRMPKMGSRVLLIGGLLAGVLAALRPSFAVASALVVSVAIACLACWRLASACLVRIGWYQPAFQMPLGLVWSVGSQYFSNTPSKRIAARSDSICRRKWLDRSRTPISI